MAINNRLTGVASRGHTEAMEQARAFYKSAEMPHCTENGEPHIVEGTHC